MTLHTRARIVALVSALVLLMLLGLFMVTYEARTRVERDLALTGSLRAQITQLRTAVFDHLLHPAGDRRAPVATAFTAIDLLLEREAGTIAVLAENNAQVARDWNDLRQSVNHLHRHFPAHESGVADGGVVIADRILADSDALARSMNQVLHHAVEQLIAVTAREKLALGVLLVAMVGLGLGFYLTFQRAILGPVEQIRTAAIRIADGDLETRIKSRRRDELGELAQAFDRMLDQLQDTMVSRDRLEAERTERTLAEQALRGNEERLQLAMEVSRSFAFEWATAGDLVRRSANSGDILGLSPAQADQEAGQDHFDRIVPADRERFTATLASLTPGMDRYRIEYHYTRGDGALVILEESGRGFFDATGRLHRLVGAATDITERRLAAAAARAAQARYQGLVNANVIGVALGTASGEILEANDYYLDLVGYTHLDLAEGTVSWRDVTPPEWLPADEQALAELHARGTCTPYEKEYLRRDGSRTQVLIVDALLPGNQGHILCLALDVAERKRMEQELRNLAVTDPLTGAMNRRYLMQMLESETRRAQRYSRPLALIMFDVDHFKAINDTHGHDRGDAVLVAVVEQVQQRLRRSDTLARWGGEEFMILLPETQFPQAMALAETLRRGLHAVQGDGAVTASFGVTAYSPTETLDQWLKRVDDLVFQAKHAGRNRVAA
ncbi:diguanylate cyclase [Lamprocystis purpurea]|uniref:diguanylate cyclase n=1 Tax=Lamprocystis purpurea TaxID=61598 RepID=UPI00035ED2B0|nr:diguanylate cyclase [Lamprocystis purpurea]